MEPIVRQRGYMHLFSETPFTHRDDLDNLSLSALQANFPCGRYHHFRCVWLASNGLRKGSSSSSSSSFRQEEKLEQIASLTQNFPRCVAYTSQVLTCLHTHLHYTHTFSGFRSLAYTCVNDASHLCTCEFTCNTRTNSRRSFQVVHV